MTDEKKDLNENVIRQATAALIEHIEQQSKTPNFKFTSEYNFSYILLPEDVISMKISRSTT